MVNPADLPNRWVFSEPLQKYAEAPQATRWIDERAARGTRGSARVGPNVAELEVHFNGGRREAGYRGPCVVLPVDAHALSIWVPVVSDELMVAPSASAVAMRG